jgi:hypothetical protein
VQTVPAGQMRKVSGLSDAQISAVAQTAGCVVLRSDTKGKMGTELGSARATGRSRATRVSTAWSEAVQSLRVGRAAPGPAQ